MERRRREKKDLSNAPAVLYVDDEETNLKLFKRGFRRDFNIIITTSGQEALEIIRSSNNVKLLITDQTMPEMKGTELIECVTSEFPELAKIILTGFADNPEVIEAIDKFDVYECINKPYDKDSLMKILINIVGQV